MSQEAEYIIARAREYENRIVKIGGLVLFSTQTGDAWLLDPDDHFALCLARGGDRQFFQIIDSPTAFRIEWTANYHIDDGVFYVIGHSGQVQMIVGYPIAEILQATGA